MLESNFKELQRTVHPDRFFGRSVDECEASAAASSAVNVAYRILRHPATRAQYMLRLRGAAAPEEVSQAARAVDPALLADVMEAREALEDASASVPTIEALRSSAVRRVEACVDAISTAFAAGDIVEATRESVALQYYQRVVAEADERLEAHAARPADSS